MTRMMAKVRREKRRSFMVSETPGKNGDLDSGSGYSTRSDDGGNQYQNECRQLVYQMNVTWGEQVALTSIPSPTNLDILK